MKKNIFITIFIINILILGCDKKNKTAYREIPYVNVNISLDLSLPLYIDLSYPNHFIYLEGGYKGIFIFNTGTDYVAFDRCCTYNPIDECERVEVDKNGVLRCGHIEYSGTGNAWVPCCNSSFSMSTGAVMSGKAQYPLRRYNVIKSGNTIFISN